ncbi:MAG: VTT domain-containing protein [Peptococcaceae bacterium]|nr:VTT domain-containing protein [Peptococcaceae bacterium]
MKLKHRLTPRDFLIVILLLLFIGFLIWLAVQYTAVFGDITSEDWVTTAENLRDMLQSYGNFGILIITFLHIFHAVIAFIPAGMVQFMGGMIYGTPIGMLTGLIGVSLGTAIAFYMSRLLGKRVVTLFVSEKILTKMEKLLARDISAFMLLILFMLPTPKEFFAYFVGLSDMKASKFFLISFIGRLPGMLIATYLGTHIFDRNYALIIGVIVFAGVGSFLLYAFKDKLLALYAKRNHKKAGAKPQKHP